jgi:hypothetical protein
MLGCVDIQRRQVWHKGKGLEPTRGLVKGPKEVSSVAMHLLRPTQTRTPALAWSLLEAQALKPGQGLLLRPLGRLYNSHSLDAR